MEHLRNIEFAPETKENPENLIKINNEQTLKIKSKIKQEDERFFERNKERFNSAIKKVMLLLALVATEGCGRNNKTEKKVQVPPPVVSKNEGLRRVIREFDTTDNKRIRFYNDDTFEVEELPAPRLITPPVEKEEAQKEEREEAVVENKKPKEEREEAVVENKKPKVEKKKVKTKKEKAAEKEEWEKQKAEKLKNAREYLEKLDSENKNEGKRHAKVTPGSEEDYLNSDVHLKMHDDEEKAMRNKPPKFNNYFQK